MGETTAGAKKKTARKGQAPKKSLLCNRFPGYQFLLLAFHIYC